MGQPGSCRSCSCPGSHSSPPPTSPPHLEFLLRPQFLKPSPGFMALGSLPCFPPLLGTPPTLPHHIHLQTPTHASPPSLIIVLSGKPVSSSCFPGVRRCPAPPHPCLLSYPGEPAVTFCHLWSVLSSLTESSPGGEVWPLLAHCLTSYSSWPSTGSRRSRAPYRLAWAEGPLPEVLSLLLGEGGQLSLLGKPK